MQYAVILRNQNQLFENHAYVTPKQHKREETTLKSWNGKGPYRGRGCWNRLNLLNLRILIWKTCLTVQHNIFLNKTKNMNYVTGRLVENFFNLMYNQPFENQECRAVCWFSTTISSHNHSKTWIHNENKNHLFYRRPSKFQKHKH